MNKLCIICPAILDIECYQKHFDTLDNIFFNRNTFFEYIIHLDDHLRESSSICTKDDYINLVKKINEKYTNVNASIFISNPRLGLPRAMQFLFKKFLDTDSQYCVVIEDDSEILNKIHTDGFLKLLNSKEYIYRLSFGAGHRSSENPFLVNQYFSTEGHNIFENKKNFCSQNGTFFPRSLVSSILNNYRDNIEPENFISSCESFKGKKIRTIFSDLNADFNESSKWRLPKECHILYDSIRFLRRVGWSE